MNTMKFFFNHYSFSLLETKEECKVLLIDLIQALDLLDSKIKLTNFDFFVEVESFWNLLLIEELTLEKLLEELGRDVENFFIDFISRSNKIENLFSLDNYLEMIPSYDIQLKDDGNSEQYYLLSLSYDLDGFLLSVNKNIWNKSFVKAWKVNSPNYEQVELKNIANKLHSLEFINIKNKEIKEEIISKLPHENIFYAQEFKDAYISEKYSILRTKIIEKIKKAEEINFEINGFLVKSIEGDIWQIKVGSQGGLQQSAVRVLFKRDDLNIYIVHIFTKQGGNTYNYNRDISIAKENYNKLREDLNDAI